MKKRQGIYSVVIVAVISMFGMQAALADVTVVYKMTYQDGSASQTIHYADKQHVRVDMGNVANKMTTMMQLGDKVYMITGEVVQDTAQLAKMMAMMGKGPQKSQTKHAPVKYEDTGRTETIAGITGKVYRFEARGKKHEIVLAKNKDLQEAVLGLVAITKASLGTMSDNPMNMAQQDASIKSMAMLRLDDSVRLQSIKHGKISDSEFVLPAKPQQLGPGLEGLFGR